MKYLKKYKINENLQDDTYDKLCKVDLNYSGVDFNGSEISDIVINDIRLSYAISVDAKSWGLRGINIYNYKGPEEINFLITYYINDSEGDCEESEEEITLKIDWDKVIVEYTNEQGIYAVNNIEIKLENDKDGGIVVDRFGMKKTGDIYIKEVIINVDTF